MLMCVCCCLALPLCLADQGSIRHILLPNHACWLEQGSLAPHVLRRFQHDLRAADDNEGGEWKLQLRLVVDTIGGLIHSLLVCATLSLISHPRLCLSSCRKRSNLCPSATSGRISRKNMHTWVLRFLLLDRPFAVAVPYVGMMSALGVARLLQNGLTDELPALVPADC